MKVSAVRANGIYEKMMSAPDDKKNDAWTH